MSVTKKIIPCLDVDNRKVVKGKKFLDVQEVADPLTLAKKYVADGADELVFYDISASTKNRGMFLDLIEEIAKEVPVPFIVGGGIRTLEDVDKLFELGGNKVSINSAALTNPQLIKEVADKYGSERVMLSMDVRQTGEGTWSVFAKGGMEETGIDAIEWAKKMENLGAGELVVNSIDEDGVKDGYNLELNRAMAEAVNIPIIASGGAGKPEHFKAVLTEGKADAALAASVFHFNEINIRELKNYLSEENISVRND
ncbi:imidazole glycerol phosphate synthase subunit HisF [Sporosarcina sp. P37]|uniref:imidazole glycerol phosphate synthase subunit HisF n=1 Tax=unclassified Sporosarcina TaxID=2647733 RepID=UPI000A17D1F6|nr:MULTISPECIES: imidazole glycerol phosphate synthase subunit HisF [unclassified Sporosarcina]ARK23870.1 imidazole glycerol phosphate synthase subunit HisF [Sporosarcina sp. P37]PID17809.1 imidazole glycerol phosphate synthase subunit HisF [Sporosarcina sp. P35]